MKYIGIRGHRGAGKNTVAYLLANTLDWITKSQDDNGLDFHDAFIQWCREIKEDETRIDNLALDWVIVEGFGDGPKVFVSMLTGIQFSDMNNDWAKDHIVINIKDFTNGTFDDPKAEFGDRLVTAQEYFEQFTCSADPEPVQQDVYMTLRELILYFGIYIMQNAFGRNVWVKAMIANQRFFDGLYGDDEKGYKIYSDIKARSEISYIYDRGGVIVKVSRPDHKKPGGMDLLRGDSRYDYTVDITGELEDLEQTIYNIAKNISER